MAKYKSNGKPHKGERKYLSDRKALRKALQDECSPDVIGNLRRGMPAWVFEEELQYHAENEGERENSDSSEVVGSPPAEALPQDVEDDDNDSAASNVADENEEFDYLEDHNAFEKELKEGSYFMSFRVWNRMLGFEEASFLSHLMNVRYMAIRFSRLETCKDDKGEEQSDWFRLTAEDLKYDLGMSKSTQTRMLNRFKKRGYVDFCRKGFSTKKGPRDYRIVRLTSKLAEDTSEWLKKERKKANRLEMARSG